MNGSRRSAWWPTSSRGAGLPGFRPYLLHPLALAPGGLFLFRVGLGLVLLKDLLAMLPWWGAFFSDGGLLEREQVMALAPPRVPLFFGSDLWNGALYGLLILLALAFTLGIRARWTGLLAGVLALGLMDRNPWLWNTGHSLVPALLLLAALLPLEAGPGFDRALLRRPPPPSLVSVGALPFLLLLLAAYVVNAAAKDIGSYFLRGDAVAGALVSSHGSVLGVELMERFPGLLPWLSRYTFLVEAGAPFLLLLPLWPLRLLGLVLLMSLHVGFALFLDVGHFPFVMLSALALLLPPQVFRLPRRRALPEAVVHYDGGCGFCRRVAEVLTGLLLARARLVPAEGEARALMEARRSWVVEVEGQAYTEGRGFQGLLLASPLRPLALLWRLPGFPWLADRAYRLVADRRPPLGWTRAYLPARDLHPNPPWAVLLALAFTGLYGYLSWEGLVTDYRGVRPEVSTTLASIGLDLRWGHFAPKPPGRADWVQAQGVTVSGRTVDPWRWTLLGDPAYRVEVPRYPVLLSGGEHWRKFWWGAWRPGKANEARWTGLALYLCDRWNAVHGGADRLHTVTLYHGQAMPGAKAPVLRPMRNEVCP